MWTGDILVFCMMIHDCYLRHLTMMYKLQGSLLSTQLILLYHRGMQTDVSSTYIVVFRPCKYIKTKITIATSIMWWGWDLSLWCHKMHVNKNLKNRYNIYIYIAFTNKNCWHCWLLSSWNAVSFFMLCVMVCEVYLLICWHETYRLFCRIVLELVFFWCWHACWQEEACRDGWNK